MKTLLSPVLFLAFFYTSTPAAIPPHPERPVPRGDKPAEAAHSNNAFGIDLYGRLKAEPGNLFFSSYSIASALAMTYAGADGDTAAQMQKVLHLPGDDAAHAGIAALNASLANAQNGDVEMSIANALWPKKGYPFLETFLKTTRTHYGAALTPIDYSDPAAAAGVINRWVAEQTRGKIKDIVPADLDPATRLILTNAIYFKGGWSNPFEEKQTRDVPFHLSDGSSPKVPMMTQKDRFRYAEIDGLQVLEMPYRSGGPAEGSDAAKRVDELKKMIAEKRDFMRRARLTREGYQKAQAELRGWQTEIDAIEKEHGDGTDRLSMAILLPDEKDGIAALEEKLTVGNLDRWLAATRSQKVQVDFPKFKLETKFSLPDTLKSLGMADAFSEIAADFSKMSNAESLFISDVLHKAFVEVNEEGTEAAAATAVTIRPTSARIPKPDPRFVADHPFIFLIRDQKTGAILFMGRLSDPRG